MGPAYTLIPVYNVRGCLFALACGLIVPAGGKQRISEENMNFGRKWVGSLRGPHFTHCLGLRWRPNIPSLFYFGVIDYARHSAVENVA